MMAAITIKLVFRDPTHFAILAALLTSFRRTEFGTMVLLCSSSLAMVISWMVFRFMAI